MDIYIGEIVAQVQYAIRDAPISKFQTTAELIDAHAEILWSEFQAKTPVAKFHISNWYPELVNKTAEEIFSSDFSLDQSRLTLSREFGYADWSDAQANSQTIEQEFEKCVDLVLHGDLEGVSHSLERNPETCKTDQFVCTSSDVAAVFGRQRSRNVAAIRPNEFSSYGIVADRKWSRPARQNECVRRPVRLYRDG